jgi:alpha-N-arabinofuranosidase
VIRYSRCSGIALGKYGDAWDNKSQSADAYNKTIERALQNGWSSANIGHHLVRNNTISHCEQTGVVGSLGAAFSTVTGNTIHDIHLQQLFSGAEMAGIKFHGAIDVEISRNHIYRTCRGVWLDWMAQGAHVTGNLFHDNQEHDLFMEVDHGPYLVANNIFLSPKTLLLVSQGGAYAHNLIAGGLDLHPFDARTTPLHKAHSTALAGLSNNPCGDDRFYNNLFVQRGNLSPYDKTRLPVWMEGNVFLQGTKSSTNETAPLIKSAFDPAIQLVEQAGGVSLQITLDKAWGTEQTRKLVTTELLGKAKIPDLPFENADGSPIRIATDYFGAKRNTANPFPGPFELREGGQQTFVVWPVMAP